MVYKQASNDTTYFPEAETVLKGNVNGFAINESSTLKDGATSILTEIFQRDKPCLSEYIFE